MTKIIGITGGIASGKSTVARMFAGRGIRHVDADALVHKLMREDKETMRALNNAFPQAATKNGIDRAALAKIVTQTPAAFSILEGILHPRVRALEEKAILRATRDHARALILDIPLLFETAADEVCDIVIAVDAPMSQRKRRAFMRPGMTQEKWQRILARQWPASARKHWADIVISTGIGKAHTRSTVKKLMQEWGL